MFTQESPLGFEQIPLELGRLLYCPNWLQSDLASRYFSHLQRSLVWEQSKIRIAGKEQSIPRLNAWYGDKDAHYQYSGKSFTPLLWVRPLQVLRHRLRNTAAELAEAGLPLIGNADFNSALANFYRDGNDSVAWHADDEPELGVEPVIASISLGGTRDFLLKPKPQSGIESKTLKLTLEHGSLLWMDGALQQNWLHSIPKRSYAEPRINLTFRCVITKKNK